MLERLAPAALAAMLLGLTVTGTVPAEAQTTTEAAAEKPAAAAVQPASPAATPPATPASEAAPAPAPAPTPAVAEPPPPPPVDPLLAEIRRQLAEPPRGNVERADRTALTTYYAASEAPFLWVAKDGFTPRARHAMAEIAKADDWGLTASAFELPQLPQGEASAAVLAAAEIKLGLAVLKYARHARGGRLDPAALSKHLDMKPTLREPKAVLDAVAATDTPGDYLRALHPRHQQFQRLRQALLKARGGGSAARPAEPASADPTAVRLPDGPQLKLGSEHPHVALLRQRLGVPASRGAREGFRSRAAGCAQDLPGPQQHPGLGPADAAHARRAQRRRAERQAAGQARARGVRGPAADRQHGALALDARGAGRDAHLGQHPGVHRARLQEGAGHPYRQDHRRQAEHADGGLLRHR